MTSELEASLENQRLASVLSAPVGGGGGGCREGEREVADGSYLVVRKGGGRGKQPNHALFPIVLMLCTILLVPLSPISCSAEETSLDTKKDQVDPNT
jgi:hypothetical protein